MIEHTYNQLRQLKLTGMASALQTQMDQPGTSDTQISRILSRPHFEYHA